MAKKYDLDIKNVLNALDTRDYDWYPNLNDSEKKNIQIWQLMRFMSSCQNNSSDIQNHYLIMTNDVVNVNFNLLKNEPELQFLLLQIVGLGIKQYHPWIPPPKRSKTDKMFQFLCEKYPQYSDDEIYDLLSITDKKDIIQFLKDNGLSDAEIKEYTK